MPNGTVIEVRSGQLPTAASSRPSPTSPSGAEAEAHVARLASQDPLTGLPNRRVFRAALEQMSGRQGSPGEICGPSPEFAVLFLDLDRFKVVNDTLGHRIGDLLLQEVAKRLKSSLSRQDYSRGWAATSSPSWCAVVESRDGPRSVSPMRSAKPSCEPYVIERLSD